MSWGIDALGAAGAEGRRARLRVGLLVLMALAIALFADFTGTSGATPGGLVVDSSRYAELQNGYDLRAAIYCLIAAAAAFALVAIYLRAQGARGLREISTDLGVAGVVWLVVSVVMLFISEGGGITPDFATEQTFGLVGLLLGAAAVGTVASHSIPAWRPTPLAPPPPPPTPVAAPAPRSSVDGPPPPPPPPNDFPSHSLLDPLPLLAIASTVIAVALSLVQDSGRGECGTPDPGWTDDVLNIAAILALFAAGAGVALLAQRRWLLALLSIAIAPLVVFFAALVSACLS